MALGTDILEQRNLEDELAATQLKLVNATDELARRKKVGKPKFATSAANGTDDIPFYNRGKNYLAGYVNPDKQKKRTYHETLPLVRWFYENDPVAGTVVNRMAEMSVTVLRNRKKTKKNLEEVTPEVLAFFDALNEQLKPFFKIMALEYLLHGMALPQYTTARLRGDKIAEKLGRKRYTTLEKIWVRNPDHIELKRRPTGMDRQVFYKVPQDEIVFIQNKGVRSDGTEDREAYEYLVENFPDYVKDVQKGKTKFPLDDVRPIYRKQNSYDEYPIPFLQNALKSLQHKEYLKSMDRSIASRAIEAIRHVRVGDKDFPADDDDITAVENMVTTNSSAGERIFNLFTNHTVEIEWVFPPLDALLNEAKYAEPNSDIFLGLGFPRILTVGETAKSNAADNKIASLGPKATLEDLRDAIIAWLKELYLELAEINNFDRVPEPYFAPIATTDMTALIQFAIEALTAGAISKDTVSQLYGSDYETEAGQILTEQEMGVLSPGELATQKEQEFQLETKEKDQEFQEKQGEVSHERNLETIEKQPKPAAKPAAK
jgi:hypothetical protein